MQRYFRRHIALPNDHGSWVFLISPLLIGIFAAGQWSTLSIYLVVAAFMGFLIRQPVTYAIKAYSGRRSKRDLPAAYFWTSVYALIGGLHVLGLVLRGFSFVLILAIPGFIVFGWHLYLVSQRSERRQMGIDIVASGTLALAAPAAFWIGLGAIAPEGWWLWLLSWLQSAASIVYAFLRLGQRGWSEELTIGEKFQRSRRALGYTSFNLVLTLVAGQLGWLPIYIWTAYLLQWLETLWGVFNPAIGWKPTRVGIRQLIVSTIFTILFIIFWMI
ncbi:MAG: hypothetical protein DWQ07_24065 [Chloroflexi bacterium]|nr:MAG: hypothetical protein DWQ07_24065 [Chloroflexota bacterium]MBL1194224.1 hypothetical protein [Chloroflexota bacterium]NOH11517.1 YwiC-like family protein [Chloroflexota bacterium]